MTPSRSAAVAVVLCSTMLPCASTARGQAITFDFGGPALDARLAADAPFQGTSVTIGDGVLTIARAPATAGTVDFLTVRYTTPVGGDFAASVRLSRAAAATARFGLFAGPAHVSASRGTVFGEIALPVGENPMPPVTARQADDAPELTLFVTRVGSLLTNGYSVGGGPPVVLASYLAGAPPGIPGDFFTGPLSIGLEYRAADEPAALSGSFAAFTIVAASSVPEPATVSLVALGLTALGLRRCRRRA